jgi:hypothetical protein
MALALFLCLAPNSRAQTSWYQAYSNADYVLFGVAYGNGELVMGGEVTGSENTVPFFISPTGNNWVTINAGISTNNYNAINAVSFVNGSFLAGLTGQIAISSSAVQWNLEDLNSVEPGYLYQTAYGQGVYATAAQSGATLSSVDGTNWTVRASNIANDTGDWLFSIAYGNGVFVTVGGDGNTISGTVVTSPDGTNWTLVSASLAADGGDSLNSVAFGNGLFAAVSEDGSIVTSPDGTNWSAQVSPASTDSGGNGLNWITYGDGRFLAVGPMGTIVLSTDGTNWVQDSSGTDSDLFGATYFQNGQFVIVGGNISGGSGDGIALINRLPTFGAANVPDSGCIHFTLVGLSGAMAVLQSSPSLSAPDWQPILTNIISNSTTTFTDCPGAKAQFYRASVQ